MYGKFICVEVAVVDVGAVDVGAGTGADGVGAITGVGLDTVATGGGNVGVEILSAFLGGLLVGIEIVEIAMLAGVIVLVLAGFVTTMGWAMD